MQTAMHTILSSLEKSSFLKLVLSPPKTTLRLLATKKEKLYQLSETRGAQIFHKNLSKQELVAWLQNKAFKQGQLFCTDADYHLFFPSKAIKKLPTLNLQSTEHNRTKKHMLSIKDPPTYLKALDIKQNKFLQIEKFLQEVKSVLPYLPKTKKIAVVDFGCGKAYLTFALYDFLKDLYEVELIGIDRKKEVMENCQKLAEQLGYQGLSFRQGSIEDLPWSKADLVVALHACDTATDAALKKGVTLSAQVLLCAPCCQHELYTQVECAELKPLLKHGILKERFAALATDAARGAWLESQGYKVQIVEFIDAAHTPKNILIRALYRGQNKSLELLSSFNNFLHISPTISN